MNTTWHVGSQSDNTEARYISHLLSDLAGTETLTPNTILRRSNLVDISLSEYSINLMSM